MNLSEELLETKFEVCSNLDLLKLYNIIEELFNEKNRCRIGKERTI